MTGTERRDAIALLERDYCREVPRLQRPVPSDRQQRARLPTTDQHSSHLRMLAGYDGVELAGALVGRQVVGGLDDPIIVRLVAVSLLQGLTPRLLECWRSSAKRPTRAHFGSEFGDLATIAERAWPLCGFIDAHVRLNEDPRTEAEKEDDYNAIWREAMVVGRLTGSVSRDEVAEIQLRHGTVRGWVRRALGSKHRDDADDALAYLGEHLLTTNWLDSHQPDGRQSRLIGRLRQQVTGAVSRWLEEHDQGRRMVLNQPTDREHPGNVEEEVLVSRLDAQRSARSDDDELFAGSLVPSGWTMLEEVTAFVRPRAATLRSMKHRGLIRGDESVAELKEAVDRAYQRRRHRDPEGRTRTATEAAKEMGVRRPQLTRMIKKATSEGHVFPQLDDGVGYALTDAHLRVLELYRPRPRAGGRGKGADHPPKGMPPGWIKHGT